MAWDPAAWANECREKFGKIDAVLILAGGIDDDGKVHSTVARRIEAAAALYAIERVPLVMNGGGTAHKPKWCGKTERHDAAGFPVPEAHIMGNHAVSLGVARGHIYPEGFSDDTLGNAFFARTMHTEWRPQWRRLLLITSDFQMPRAEAVYKWMFSLAPPPAGRPYEIVAMAVPDEGTLPEDVLQLRREREAQSLVNFGKGTGKTITTMEACQEWLFQGHKAYAVPTEQREALDPSLLKTY